MTACVHDHGAYGAQRYGAADRIGAGNLLTAERRLAALSLVRTGALHDLGHVIENGAPRARVGVMLRRPQAGEPEDAESLLLQSCLTLDGTGGRLEQLQEEAGLGHLSWQTELLQLPDAEALLMTTEATGDEAARLWRVVLRARQSLVDVPPTPSELQLAFRRTRLAAELPMLDADARLRQFGRLATRNLSIDVLRDRLAASAGF